MKKTTNLAPAVANTSGYKIDASAFDSLSGEKFLGLNIIKLEIGEAGGPFVLIGILKDQNLSKKVKLKKGQKPKLVDVYVGSHNGSEIRMPASASFVEKAKSSRLAVGDTFAIKRVANYPNPHGGKDGQGFELIIIERSKKS